MKRSERQSKSWELHLDALCLPTPEHHSMEAAEAIDRLAVAVYTAGAEVVFSLDQIEKALLALTSATERLGRTGSRRGPRRRG